MKRIELKDIFNEPNPKDFGFKNRTEYEKLRKENAEKWQKRERYKTIVISLIVLIEIVYLYNVEGPDSYLLLFIFVDAILFQFINMFIENMFMPEDEDRVMDYMNECIAFGGIASISRNWAEEEYYNILNLEKEHNRFLRPILDENICIDALLIKIMNNMNYKHKLILKAIDEMLIPNIKNNNASINSELDITMALAFLVGLNVISEDEANERDIYRMDLMERVANQAYGIIIDNNKILLKKEKNGMYSILSIIKDNKNQNIKEILLKYIEKETKQQIKSIKYSNEYNTDLEGNFLSKQEYKEMSNNMQLDQVKTTVIFMIELKQNTQKKINGFVWNDIDGLKREELNPYTYEILCEENIID